MKTLYIISGLFLCLPAFALADTLLVPGEYPSIQEAIQAAAPGDEVIVAPGTYVENIDFQGKGITVKSSGTAEDTVIDGNQAGSVVTFTGTKRGVSVLEGFTITNGSGTLYEEKLRGGGIFCLQNGPIIRHNIVSDNTADFGGGIYLSQGASPLIENNVISDNRTKKGAGIFFDETSSGTVSENTIKGNIAKIAGMLGGIGGGIFLNVPGEVRITNNLIEYNSSWGELVSTVGYGGGIMAYDSQGPLEIRDNVIRGNEANYGGGIYSLHDANQNVVIERNELSENFAYHGGGIMVPLGSENHLIVNNRIFHNRVTGLAGGIYFYQTLPLTANNLIIRNRASYGGGVDFDEVCDQSSLFTNNTIVKNSAMWGGGLRCEIGCDAMIENSILWNNTASKAGDEIFLAGHPDNPTSFAVSHCDVMGGEGAISQVGEVILTWEVQNLSVDPGFVDAQNSDFHLAPSSACINMGRNNEAILYDIDEESRPCMGTADMGADEFTGTHALEADDFFVPSSGGSVDFTLHGGVAHAGRPYLVLGGMSGTAPGTPLPGGQTVLPLNWDLFTHYVFTQVNTHPFEDFMGVLDSSGDGSARLNWPDLPGAEDLVLSFTYLLDRPYEFVSNPINIEIQPAD